MSEGIKRRDFLKAVGVSGAGASLVGCSTESVERLIPYVVPPEEITPGVATWYTSVCRECPAECGVWVRTREGRVIKLEGNPNHPVSQGALCSRGHASVQGLYNPDRFPGPMRRAGEGFEPISWDEAEALLAERLQAAGGDALLITGRMGPTLDELVDDFVSVVGGSRIRYQGLAEAPLREATRIAFGRDVVPRFDFSAARFLVSFGADFLETWLSPVEYGQGFARMSAVDGRGSKGTFVAVTPRLSLSGMNADEWVPIRPGSEAVVALAMAGIIAAERGNGGPFADLLAAYDPETAASASGVTPEAIVELAERFVSEGPGLAVGPGVAGHHRNATAANLAVLVLNAVAGNIGRTVLLRSPHASAASSAYGDLEAGIRTMAGGGSVVMVAGTNPVYSLPPASGFVDAFQAADFRVSFASAVDETAALADLVLPDRHFLEAWGDSNPRPSVYSIQQPAMQPVPHFDSKQVGDTLLSVATRMGSDPGATTFFERLQTRWRAIHSAAGGGEDFEVFWREALRSGVVEVPASEAEDQAGLDTLRSPDAALSFDVPELDGEGLEFALVVHPSPRFGDGEQANRPWLLELPDPVSKITWHSWVEVHPAAALRLGVEDGDVVTVRSPHGELQVPVWIYPGIREDTVAIAMGGGHDVYGRFAEDKGVNPMQLLPAIAEQPSGALVHLATRVSLEPTGVRRPLATVAGAATQHDRHIVQAVSLADLREGVEEEVIPVVPEAVGAGEEEGHSDLQELQGVGGFVPVPTEGEPEDFPLEGSRYGAYDPGANPRWAMAIDLDRCTGCSACVTACQAENNVPWVGEEQVMMGREMHWIRLERYYETVDASHAGPLDIRLLPMLCQHCGNAPCEPVCPVFAAYHTPEGLNAQVYNRCVGTRYCANNCPYKVRVFNWYEYTDVPEPMNWQYNPDVTVRSNGVMEKCSFCVQRIREAENQVALEEGTIRDGDVVPACQQTCPAEAIVFGNIRDVEAEVTRWARDVRNYRVLDDLLNTQPAVNYLKKVTLHAVTGGEH